MKIIRINAMWCGGCLSMHKIWNKVSKDYPNLEIINYDYDMDEDIIKEYNVGTLLPVAIFFDNNKEITRLNGEKSYEEIVEIIDNYK